MDQSFSESIFESNSVLIHLPTKPYFDQVAAGLALYLSLRNNKEVSIYCPSPMTVDFNRLVGVNKIKETLGNKNLVIRFTDYDGKNIERVSADIEDGLFKLTIIPKPSVQAPQSSQIDTSYSGLSSDTVILVGGANESHFPSLSSKDVAGTQLLHIGTRPLNTSKPIKSYVNDASSVSEVVSSLIIESSIHGSTHASQQGKQFLVDSDIATNLMMGIEASTENLSSETATADTFYYVSELMRAGGRRNKNTVVGKSTDYPPGAIPQQPQKSTGSKQPVVKQSQNDEENTPKDWLEKPRIYKGTNN